MTTKELLETKKFDYVNSDITEAHFPQPKEVMKVTKLFKFDKRMTSAAVVEAMDKEGYWPANLYDLLAYEWDGKDNIVALGSVWQNSHGGRRVPYLCEFGDERGLCLRFWGGDWFDFWFFAAVSKSEILGTSDSFGSSEPLNLRTLEKRVRELEAFKEKVEGIIKL